MTFLPEQSDGLAGRRRVQLLAVFGTFDVLGKGIPGGPRSFIAAIAVTFALFAVMHYPLHRLRRWRENRRVIRRYDR
jgi:hypothetical protein